MKRDKILATLVESTVLDMQAEDIQQRISDLQKQIQNLKETLSLDDKAAASNTSILALKEQLVKPIADLAAHTKQKQEHDKKVAAALAEVDTLTRAMSFDEQVKFAAEAPLKFREGIYLRIDPRPDRIDWLFALTNEILDYGQSGQICGGPEVKDKTFSYRAWPTGFTKPDGVITASHV